MRFKVGNIVRGTSDIYNITGKGSICEVVSVTDYPLIEVRVIKAAPTEEWAEVAGMVVYPVTAEKFELLSPKSSKMLKILYGVPNSEI